MDNGEALAFSLIDQWQTGNANATTIQSIAHDAMLFGHRHVCLVQIAKAGDWGLRPEQISRDLAAFAVELPHTYVRPADCQRLLFLMFMKGHVMTFMMKEVMKATVHADDCFSPEYNKT